MRFMVVAKPQKASNCKSCKRHRRTTTNILQESDMDAKKVLMTAAIALAAVAVVARVDALNKIVYGK